VAADAETPYVHRLRNRFRRKPGIAVEQVSLDSDSSLALSKYNFDTVTLINVLEHTQDDGAALRRVFQLLQPGGRVIIYVPAGHDLYGALDEGVGHQRRYEKADLVKKLTDAGFAVEEIGWQNQIARLAWLFNSKVMKRRALPAAQSKLFDRMVPLLKTLEGDKPASGLSLIAVARKPGGAPAEAPASAEAAVAPAAAPATVPSPS